MTVHTATMPVDAATATDDAPDAIDPVATVTTIDAISASIDDLKHLLQFPPPAATATDIKVWRRELKEHLLQRASLTRGFR